MQAPAIKLLKIRKELSMLPEEKLDEVKDFIEFILSRPHAGKSHRVQVAQMEGIWEGKGFEKIDNLENELKNIKRELSESILRKKI